MFKKNFRHDNKTAYLLLAPILVLLTVFVVIPFLYSVRVSFFNWSFYQPSRFVGVDNFSFVLSDDRFLKSVWIGLKFALMVTPATLVVSFLFANVIKGMGGKMSGFVKTSIYIPTVISGIVASVIFVFIYDYLGGLANYALGLFGAEPKAWLAEVGTALPSIAVPAVWLGFGLTTLIMLAGLLDIPESYYEASDLEGAGAWQKMRYITIPLLKNIFLFLTVTGFTANISQYELSLIMTNGGPLDSTMTPNLYILTHFRNDVMVGNSIAASLLLFVVLGSISAIIFKVLNSDKAIDG
ncbi:multiple sugar transport system permease protein [Paenibacillus sp. UNC496MF]|uniref:carbohydrate ABC transporter permease n=1 Tax=Paenibacillus sp. UNC496MF TaxID=1502753 RepID=UPI0008E4B686|nr:sugar ABC transporter permease [Paenibacillus sp. UNC496MF]SFI29273.1 multiple sugar transport system permease protein [Paenibacillus sp. UNC496MF]